DGRRAVAQAKQMLGVRPLGVAGRRLRLGGKGWFPRAMHQQLVSADEADDLAAWRELGAVMICRSPSDDFCRRASEQGVLIFAELSGDADSVGRIVNPSEVIPHGAADVHIRRLAQ